MKIFKLPQSDPKNFGSKRVRSKKYRELEKNGQLNLFTKGKILHMNAQSPFEKALALDEKGETEAAKKMYFKSIEMDRNTADAYCNLGIIACEEKKYAKGINYFTLSLKYNPRHYKAHFNLANTYIEIGDTKLAKIHYKVSIEIAPEFPNSYFNLGLTLAKMQEYKEAIKVLKKFLSLAPSLEQQTAKDFIQKLSVITDS
jgi:tetratricopeptide (TPR) repeat protein